MKAVIMAGGEGTRLRPLTSNQPKPMLPVANRPIMEHTLSLLRRHEITDVVVTVAFLASLIRNYFGDGGDLGMNISYATEETPLGTAGSVRNAAEELDETFLVISGDALTDIDLTAVIASHHEREALGTVILTRADNPREFGIVVTSEDGSIERFLEKPGWGQVFSDTVNTGIYVFEPEIFDHIPAAGASDFSDDVFPRLLEKRKRLDGYVAEGYWCDVGNIESYLEVHRDILDRKVAVEMDGFELRDGLWIGESADVDSDARLEGPALVGAFSRVEAGAEIGEYSVLGNNVIVRADAATQRCVVHDNAHIGPLTQLRGCVVGKNADLRRGATIDQGAVLGDDTFIGERAIVNPDVKIYPFKTVESGAVISHSIVWESKGSRHHFSERGVTGIANVDVTPEAAVRIAMAYGTSIPRGSVVAMSRDASKMARTLKRAMIAGLNATEVHVDDLEIATLPATRFHVRTERAGGGISVRTSPNDPAQVEIRILGPDGQELEEGARRKLERYLSRGDFRRAFGGEFGEIFYPPRAIEFYTAALNDAIDVETIRRAHLKVVVDHAFSPTAVVLPRSIGRLGLDLLALNGYTDPEKCILTDEERADELLRISDAVKSSGSSFGVLFDPTGEQIEIVDDTGRLLSGEQAALVFVRMAVTAGEGNSKVIALPVSAGSSLVDEVERAGGRVIWTELAPGRAAERALAGGAELAIGVNGGAMYPSFLPAFDAVLAFLKLSSYVASLSHPLSEEVDTLPESHLVREDVRVPLEDMGTVMRDLGSQARGRSPILVDGIRFETRGGWALVAPDSSEPICHLWAEGPDDKTALEIADEVARRVEEIAR